MAQLKEIRSRITSVKNTRQVTSAMKLVSAAKLKKAQDAIMQIIPYDEKLHEIIQHLSLGEVEFNPVFFSKPEKGKVLIVVVGANRGLCGAFNANASKMALMHATKNYSDELMAGKVVFLPIGRQVEKQLKIRNAIIFNEANQLIDEHNYDEISSFSDQLMQGFSQSEFQQIDIVYNKFKNAAVQELTAENFLPVNKPELDENDRSSSDYIFEPSQEEILSSLIPQSLRMRIFRILLDSNAAEHGARMTAMHQATDNATDLLRQLKTTYNNARQDAITNEILEITAGAEALKA
ncbi:ATP synthase F1 subunit gamma [Roseimarinus sediminis]|uniref:ATP synthase F1 subunit gamma n=1 Tax=Roseimarinus sediminis TaxID=1610899 RepID=UPI003D1FCF0C